MRLIATLVGGLGENSRIAKKRNGTLVQFSTYLDAEILDTLRMILWTKTKDAEKGKNKPKPIADNLREHEEAVGFSSGADFMAERERLLRMKNG